MSKSKLSEIRARYEPMYAGDIDIAYLLDLVERLGKALSKCYCPRKLCGRVIGEVYAFEDCLDCKEARELLKELKQ